MGILRQIMGILRLNYGYKNYGWLRTTITGQLWVFFTSYPMNYATIMQIMV